MTTNGYRAGQGVHPGSLTLAAGLSLAAVAGIAFSAPVIDLIGKPRPLITTNIPLQPVPPELPQPRPSARTPLQPRPLPTQTVDRSMTPVPSADPDATFNLSPTPTSSGEGAGTVIGDGDGGTVLPKLPPVITIPTMDPRYLNAFQPSYPPQEERAERPGRVVVRVLVGVDGRVEKVTRIEATSDAFFAATERQALKAWRFRPATRDNVPIQAERTITVTFRLNG